MIVKNYLSIVIASIFILIILFYFFHNYTSQYKSISSKITASNFEIFKQKYNGKNKEKYDQSCLALYHKLRFPNLSLFFKPALKEPPVDLLDEFTQHGEMPIKKWWYINEVYSDSKGEQYKQKRVIKSKEINDLIESVKV